MRESVLASLALMSRRDRRLLAVSALIQTSTGLLDVVGVLLTGVVAALSVAVLSGSAKPPIVEEILIKVGLNQVDLVTAAALVAAAAAIILVSKSVINILLTRRTLRFLANRQAVISGRLVANLLALPLLQIQRRSSQETIYALTAGVSAAILTVLGQAVIAVTEIVLLGIFVVGLFTLDPGLTIFTLLFFGIIGFILQRMLSGWATHLGMRNSNLSVEGATVASEALVTYREVLVANRRSLYVKRFQDSRLEAASVGSDMQFMGLVPKYVFEIGLIIGAILLAVSQFVTKDLYAAVTIIAIYMAAGSRIVPSILRLQNAAMGIRIASAEAIPTYELAEELGVTRGGGTPADAPPSVAVLREQLTSGHAGFEGTIGISGVSVTYPGAGEPALHNASFNIAAGQSLALTGSTGAGKSTLADVILGILEPDLGTVRMSGMKPRDAIVTWQGAIAYVPQDVSMAAGTIRENVALGLPADAIEDEWVWDALERAHLAAFLRESREGLDTIIGERGMKLSGGQRQRLGVARALYTRPRLLVLDEATSALDSETEKAIADTLRDLEGDVTTVTVAHRLATIRHCDVVLYLEAGHIVAQGSFDEVRAQSFPFDRQATLLGL
jgi:ABC-type multidrug transport system fused ATPase/permease subunit